MTWGVCTTVKAPLDQILAFVAWHKHLGAARIWVHLDDPDPASLHVLGEIEGVEAVACDDAYWRGKRPKKHQVRQGHNVQRIYAETDLPVIAHLDVDEYLWPARPVAEILSDWPGEQPFIRARPAEALHEPGLTEDIFTARHFRLPFPKGMSEPHKAATLGAYSELLPSGMLSHKVGKSLFRTGVEGLVPRLHSASIGHKSPPLHMPFYPELIVLHFHAQNRAEWTEAVPRRAERGAYQFNPPLAAFLKEASAAQVDAFYEATQIATPERLAALEADGLLVQAELRLKEKVAALF